MEEFPFKKTFMPSPEELMENLKEYAAVLPSRCSETDLSKSGVWTYDKKFPNNIRFQTKMFHLNWHDYHFYNGVLTNTRFLTHVQSPTDYERMDVLADLFTEDQRLKATKQTSKRSIMEEWEDPKYRQAVYNYCRAHFEECSPKNLRESIYKISKECTQFKPSLTASIVKLFDAKKVLDFSAGWGDRLLGCIAADVEYYHGYDPNQNLRKGHYEILETFDYKDKACIQYEPFEKAELPKGVFFDLVFTSPPFYDFEIYTDDTTQSIHNYPTLEKWIVHFLFASIRKACSVLTECGVCVIHISDVYKTRVCEPMLLLVKWLIGGEVEYAGVINTVGAANKPRPMWVFRRATRKSHQPKYSVRDAEFALKKYFPGVYSEAIKVRDQEFV
uniref:Uncharacterized protein n=1 Tax=viral metagenome TaxID=1070528 RepID=A0A6C0CKJ7_9ZZZZ